MSEETQASGGSDKPAVLMPAPTAWPFAMALGTALTFAGLLTDVSVSVLGAILTISGAVGWFRQVLPHEQHESIPVQPEEPARGASAARSYADAGCTRDTARLVAAQDLSRHGGREGRTGRRRGHGRARSALWPDLLPQCVVSDKSAGRKFIRSIGNSHNRGDAAFPDGMVPVCTGHAYHHVPACGTSLWRDAAACFRAGPLCWEASSVRCCGLACSTTSSDTSIRCSISALTGGGLRPRRPLSESWRASW